MVFSYLAGMFIILGTFLILITTFVGIGLALRRLFGLKKLTIDDCFLAFWTGFGIIILFLLFWNFLYPVTNLALFLVIAAGVAGLAVSRRALLAVFKEASWYPTWGVIGMMALVCLWVGNLSTGPFNNWDGSLYHLQGVKWADSYPVVPGIANLYGPLAFNNSSFLYFALLDAGPWSGQAFHLANGVLILVFLLQCLVNGARFCTAEKQRKPALLFSLLLLTPAFALVLHGSIVSFNTDASMALVLLVATSSLYTFLSNNPVEPAEEAYGFVVLSILLSVAVALKLSAAFFAASLMLLACILWLKHTPRGDGLFKKTFIWGSSIVLLFAITWTVRGIVLSGYPFFPSSRAGFPVEWLAPPEHADAELANIAYTEREFSFTVGGRWVKHVLLGAPFAVFVPVCLTVLSILGLFLLARKHTVPGRDVIRSKAWWMLVPSGIAITIWFILAPATRYAGAFFWTLAALTASQAYITLANYASNRASRRVFLAALCLSFSPLLAIPITQAILTGSNPLTSILDAIFMKPISDRWLHPIAHEANITTFTTDSGLVLNVPRKTTQGQPVEKCWDAPLPCTSNPAPNLRLREPGRIEKGFVVDGPWKMQDWPYYWRPDFLPRWRNRQSQPHGPRQ